MVPLLGRFVKPIVREGFESLSREIGLVRPRLILALGNTALWALTGQQSIVKWRGSLLTLRRGGSEEVDVRVVPTYHPAAVLRQWEWRNIAVADFRRAKRELDHGLTPQPRYEFLLRPSLPTILETLEGLRHTASLSTSPLWLDFDIETVHGHIRCFGISWSTTNALCVPLMKDGDWGGWWTLEEEAQIVYLVYKLFTHPNVRIRGQNLLYDFQYVHRHWHFIPHLGQDTMLSHHVLWAGLPKSLAFQASMYVDHYVYWKDLAKHDMELKAGE